MVKFTSSLVGLVLGSALFTSSARAIDDYGFGIEGSGSITDSVITYPPEKDRPFRIRETPYDDMLESHLNLQSDSVMTYSSEENINSPENNIPEKSSPIHWYPLVMHGGKIRDRDKYPLKVEKERLSYFGETNENIDNKAVQEITENSNQKSPYRFAMGMIIGMLLGIGAVECAHYFVKNKNFK